jgi:hypothetical protein
MATTGQVTLRAENIERIVKGFALAEYTMKDLVMVQSSNSWQETYYQETAADLTKLRANSTNSTIKGIPRLAGFPVGEVNWTKKSSFHLKHGLEGVIGWEDAMTNNVDVIARTLLRIARAVAKSVDAEIYNTLSESGTANLINTVAIAAGSEWNSATIANRDPIQNILDAMTTISIDNYNIHNGNGFIALNPTDYGNILGNANVRNAGQFYTDTVTKNGQVGRLLGLKVIVSNSVAADKALVGIAKECGTWKEAVPLTVVTIEDPGIKYTIRAWEIGVTQLTNPEALCLITNTAA